ncbi:MAG: IS110 family transposase, partial [Metallibacterium scheffleri]
VLVAIANKHVRQLWAMLAHEEPYDADAWLQHPMVQRLAGKHAITVAAMA